MKVKEGRNPGRGRMEWEGEVKGKDRDCLLLGGCAIIVNENDDDYSTGGPQRYLYLSCIMHHGPRPRPSPSLSPTITPSCVSSSFQLSLSPFHPCLYLIGCPFSNTHLFLQFSHRPTAPPGTFP